MNVMQIEERHVADEKTVIVKEGSNILCLDNLS